MQEKLQANELDASWLASYEGIKVLSLDCFDTLLWRKVVLPTDVFFTLAQSNAYREMGLTAPLRVKAETAARRISWVERQSAEVNLEQIYRQALPTATDAQVAMLAAAELDCEIDTCFCFQPVFDLIVQAKQCGLKVVIVSDTYLSEAQLKKLLYASMPALEGMLDAVYCSNAHQMTKGDGIWAKLLPLLKVKPNEIVHLGDNENADLLSPQRFGIRACHLIQQQPDVKTILAGRLQIAVQLLPQIHYREPVPNYYHAQIAASTQPDQLATFGYASMGPILYGFAQFVLREAARIEAGGKNVKLGFLLRDGFLPSKACAELAGAPVGSELNISRFTAIAASLDSRAQVSALLSKTLSRESMPALLKQLLLPPDTAAKILKLAGRADLPEREFARLLLEPATLKHILDASRAFRARLVSHVRKVTGAQSGDTLMFVDLGYSGTAQTLLKDILEQDMNVELIGRYLIAEEVAPHQSDRKGLLDATDMDGRIVKALTGAYIAGFEMLCTQSAPSTIDYTEAGDPVFSDAALDARQHEAVSRIQAACLRFIADARATPACHKPKADAVQVAQSVAIDLARMVYFPTPMELDCMNRFQFDFNLGTDKKLALFDTAEGLRAMRTEGFGYMNAGLDQMRTSYTMELRSLDLSLSVLLFAQNRFGFDMQPASASYRKESLQVLVTNQAEHAVHSLEAHATYDGYFSLSVPLSPNFNVGILFGQIYTWVQIDSVQLISAGALHCGVDMAPGDALLFDQMTHAQNGLFQVHEGGLLYLPGLDHYGPKLMCRVIFRPIALTSQVQ